MTADVEFVHQDLDDEFAAIAKDEPVRHTDTSELTDLAAGRDVQTLCTREEAHLIRLIRKHQIVGCDWSGMCDEVDVTFKPRLKGTTSTAELTAAFLAITHDRS